MDIGNIFEERKGIWVDFIQGAKVKFKILKPYEINEINEACKITSIEGDQLVTTTNEDKFQFKYWGSIVIDWKGFEENGKPFPCTPENVKKFCDHWELFNGFVLKTVNNIKKNQLNKEKKQRKNSKRGPD